MPIQPLDREHLRTVEAEIAAAIDAVRRGDSKSMIVPGANNTRVWIRSTAKGIQVLVKAAPKTSSEES